MKKLLFTIVALGCFQLGAQTWITIGADSQGDDHSFGMDSESLEYRYSNAQDSVYIKLKHYNVRGGDFGYAIALDTSLNPSDGSPVPQHSILSGSPNLSMNYNLIIYVYQNGFFPGVYVDTYDAQSGIWNADISVDTSDQYSITVGIRLSDIGGKTDVNILGFTGSFDIAPGGAGPSDVIPNSTFAEIRKSGIGLTELDNKVGLFPNPFKDEFYIQYSGIICLYDIVGNLVDTKNVTKNEPVHCPDLHSGMYYITSDDGRPLTKLLKQ